MKRILTVFLLVLFCLTIVGCAKEETKKEETSNAVESSEAANNEAEVEEEKEEANEETAESTAAPEDIEIPELNAGEVFVDGNTFTMDTAKNVLEGIGFEQVKDSVHPSAPMGYIDWEKSDSHVSVRVVYSNFTNEISDGTPTEMHVYFTDASSSVVALSKDIVLGQSTIDSISESLGSDFGEVDEYGSSPCTVNGEEVILTFDDNNIVSYFLFLKSVN